MSLKLWLSIVAIILIAVVAVTVIYDGWLALLIFIIGDIVAYLIWFWRRNHDEVNYHYDIVKPNCRRSDLFKHFDHNDE